MASANAGADAIFQNGPGTIASRADATFRFNISAVPEPATWATMLIGLFGVGKMLGRRPRDGPTPLTALN